VVILNGPYINSIAIILGDILGFLFASFIPKRLKEGLPASFAMISIAIGIIMVIQAKQLPAIALSIVVGVAIGELLSLEKYIQSFFLLLNGKLTILFQFAPTI
jgi:uncharacterized membrane protein YqgA involved in biofilm formation